MEPSIRKRIEALMSEGHTWTALELAEATGANITGVCRWLLDLEASGRIRVVAHYGHTGQGRIWKAWM